MKNNGRLWGLIAILTIIIATYAFGQLPIGPRTDDQQQLGDRKQALLAMEELRYRDALAIWEKMEEKSPLNAADRNNLLTCMNKLRMHDQTDKKIEQYLAEPGHSFAKVVVMNWKATRLLEKSRWRNMKQAKELFADANDLGTRTAGDSSRQLLFSELLIKQLAIFTNDINDWDLKEITDIKNRLLKLNVSNEIKAKGSLKFGEALLSGIYRNDIPQSEVLTAFRDTVKKFPETSAAATAQLRIGQLYHHERKYVFAVAELNKVIKGWPESEASKLATKLIDSTKAPRLRVYIPQVYKGGSKPVINVRYRNIGDISLKTYPFDLFSHVLESKNIETLLDNVDIDQVEPNAEVSFADETVKDYAWKNREVALPAVVNGAYLVVAEGGGMANRSVMIVSDLANLVKSTKDTVLVFAADAISGEPVPGAEVLLATGDQSVKIQSREGEQEVINIFRNIIQGKTNERGLWNGDIARIDRNERVVVIVKQDNDYALSSDHIYYWGAGGLDKPSIYTYTDRPIFRPGQKVNYKSILRFPDNGVFTFKPGSEATVTIQNPRGEEVSKETLSLNEFGTISGTFMLDDNAALGSWHISVTVDDYSDSYYFSVEEYKKPEFEVVSTASESQYRLGSEIEFEVDSKYYFGEPVKNAEVSYEIRQNNSSWYFVPAGGYDWFYKTSSRRQDYEYYGGKTVSSGKGKTDSEGKLLIKVPSAALENDIREQKVYRFSANVTVTDESRRAIEATAGTIVTSHEYNAHISADKYVYRPGDSAKIIISTRKFDGSEIASSGTLVLYSATWNKTKKDYDLQQINQMSVSTDDSGEGATNVYLEKDGYYLLKYSASDAYDKVVAAKRFVWVNSGYTRAQFQRTDGLTILPDKANYRNGDTARILITNELEDATALLTVEADKILSSRVVPLRQGANPVDIRINEQNQPNFFVKVAVIRDFAAYRAEKEIQVPPVEKFANVTIMPDKQEYKPGEEGTYIVRITDNRGRPIQAEFSIGIYDASLDYFTADRTEDIRKHFYANMHRDSVRETDSFRFRFTGVESEADDVDTFAGADMPGESRVAEYKEEAQAAAPRMKKAKLVQPEIRKDFKDSAIWLAHETTDADGNARVRITWPDNLTRWKTVVRVVSKDTKVGSVTDEVITRKNFLVRLQMPRFLVEKDEVTLSMNVHNYLDGEKKAETDFSAQGVTLTGNTKDSVDIAPGEDTRVDVVARADSAGTAKVTASALTDEESDAMELSIPVLIHGIQKTEGFANVLEAGTVMKSITLPEDIQEGSQKLVISLRPTIAGTLLDSLPYLIDYPYGCVEQTMSRFLPAAAVSYSLKKLNVDRPTLEEKLDKVIPMALKRLYDFQHSDGGWGWWKYDSSSPYMTAYVIFGLTLAQDMGVSVDEASLERGRRFLVRSLDALEDQVETLNFVIFALSGKAKVPDKYINRIADLLPEMKEYETALFAVSLQNLDEKTHYPAVIKRLRELARKYPDSGMASWGKSGGWYWYQDNVEATSLALTAILNDDENDPLVDGAVRWLLSNRKGGKWKSTRDTAMSVIALSRYLQSSSELDPDLTASVSVNGSVVKTIQFNKDNLFSEDGVVTLDSTSLQPGKLDISVSMQGTGKIYYDAYLSWFSLAEPLTASSTTIAVDRNYSKITYSVDSRGKRLESKKAISNGDSIESGDEIEVEIKLTSQNNYEYLVYEDFKPAGCEPMQLLSGRTWGGVANNVELRDEKVVFFIGWLSEGEHTIRYRLRAEIPGKFHTLPTIGYAMYAPDIAANSDEFILRIKDK